MGLLKKGQEFTIEEKVWDSFRKCKEALCGAAVLAFPDFNTEFVITTDASQVAVGAVLSQVRDGEEY